MKKISMSISAIVTTLLVCIALIGVSCTKTANVTESATTTIAEPSVTETTSEGTATVETNPNTPIELVYWSLLLQGTPQYDWETEAIEEYKANNPNIKITREIAPANEMPVMFQTMMAAHRGADVVGYWEGEYMFPLKDGLLDLKKYFNESELAQFRPEVLLTGYYNYDTSQALLGVPAPAFGFYHFVYNKAMLKDAGVTWEPTKENDYRMTWDEFIDTCNKLKAKGYVPLGWGNDGGFMSTWYIARLYLQTFEEDDYLKLYSGEMKWNDPKILEAFKRVNDLVKAGYFNKGGLTLGWDEGINLTANKKVAIQAAFWPWVDTQAINALGADFGMMKDPVFNPNGPLSGTMMGGAPNRMLVPSWTQYPKEATDFIKFLLSKENQESLYKAAGDIPVLKEIDNSIFTKEQDKLAWQWINEKPLTPNYDNTVTPSEIFYEFAAQSVELFNGTITPQQCVDNIETRFEQLKYPWITGIKK
jgi:raffinose/stachyose/melibiose transport system substrate-binding protein